MVATFTATNDAANGRVQLTLNWTAMTSATVSRTDPDGTINPVRSGNPATLVAGVWTDFDYEAPVGVTANYTAVSNTGATLTASAAVSDTPYAKVWLKHPGKPALNMLVDVSAPGIENQVRAARREVLTVVGRSRPVVLSVARAGLAGTVTVMVPNTTVESNLLLMLADGAPLLLQAPVIGHLGNIYMSVADVSVVPHPDLANGYRDYTLPFDQVDVPAGAALGGSNNTWAVLLASWANWGTLAASGHTWSDLVVNSGSP